LVKVGDLPAATVLGIDYHDASIAHVRAEAAAASVGNARFEVVAATELAGGDYDLITTSTRCATSRTPLRHFARPGRSHPQVRYWCSSRWPPTMCRATSPRVGRMFHAVSTLACTPNAVSQRTGTSSEPLGAQAGEKRLRALAGAAGFTRVRRSSVEAPMNLILQLRP
jgi:hypothetical protein